MVVVYAMDLFDIDGPFSCSYTDVTELASPDGKKIVKLGYSDCGATTNWQSGIRIVDVKSGKVFRGLLGLNGKPEKLELNWKSNTKLIVSNFQIENLLWFKNDNFAGAWIELRPSMAYKQINQDK